MRDVTIFVVLICLLIQQTEASYVCDENWQLNTSYCYQFIKVLMNWQDAQAECEKVGAHLPIIHGEKQFFINKNLDGTVYYWIGLNDRITEGDYKWLDTDGPVDYTHWIKREPDSLNATEDCVALYLGSSVNDPNWYDVDCLFLRYYICQKDAKETTLVISGSLKASMSEEEAVGNIVPFTFTVTDSDTPTNKLKFVLSGVDAAKFTIEEGGVIKLAEILDYEAGQRNFILRLEVTDTTPTTVSKHLTLLLLDINDNSPICSPDIIYTGVITETDVENTIATTLSCSDGDRSSPNKDITLTIVDAPPEFKLSGNNIVTTGTETNYEDKVTYKLIITAVDGGDTKKTGTAIVFIEIQPLNEFSPVWQTFSPTGHSHTIREDARPGTSIVTILATDEDHGVDGAIAYTLQSTVTDGGATVQGIFSLDSISGQLSTLSKLDRDGGISSYTVTARATDGGIPSKSVETVLIIVIDDVNDNAPVFESASYSKTVLETYTTNGVSILSVTATDKDATASSLSYDIEAGNTDQRFEFGLSSGLLKLKQYKAIDLDNGVDPSVYTLRIIATDGGSPEKTGTSYVTITVTAVNESPPVIGTLIPSSPISVKEDIGIGTVIVTVPATDADELSGETITFAITAGNTDSDFVIDPTRGIVYNQNRLNYERTSKYELTVSAIDSGSPSKTGTVSISIVVEDVNEAPPICAAYYISTSVQEAGSVGDLVTTLTCTDTEPLTSAITTGDTSIFEIDSTTQQVKLKQPLNYEDHTSYLLMVEVHDSTSPVQTVTVTITVFVTPLNEYEPSISPGPYIASVSENDAVGTSVERIMASDSDEGLLHGTLRYSITGGNGLGHFAIDSTGIITIAKSLDLETTASYSLTISVADDVPGAINAHTTTADVSVTVTDWNDNPPVFNPVLYIISHMETTGSAIPLVSVTSTDGDSGSNNNPLYTVLSGDVDNIFEMSEAKLQLKSGESMNYTKRHVHYLVIQVNDRGSPPLTAEAKIIINVLSVDSNPPVLSGSSETLPQLSESTAIGTSIYQVVATDSDSGMNGVITYSIESGNGQDFDIESTTGKIFVWSLLDYDSGPRKYDLVIKAEDSGGKTDTMQVHILLKNENDNIPKFSATVFNLNVDENVASSTTIAPPIVATDDDFGTFGDVSYSLIEGDGTSTFSIDSTSGMISTAAALDYETQASYTVVVKAVDGGAPANSATCLVIITVKDLNDNTPEFTPSDITISVSESTSVNTAVITLVATDDDSAADENNVITYSLSSAFFTINPSSGEITTKTLLDRESVERHRLFVKAYDRNNGDPKSLTGTSTVIVKLTDINDNPPVITGAPYDFSILETLTPGSIIVSIAASDLDAGENARLNFIITSGATHDDFVIEIHSGMIQLANVLDRDTINKYFLEVTVSDNGTPAQSATVTCSITILDINDNVPTFSESSYSFSITENDPPNTIAGSVAATDADTGVNGDFTFEFVNFWTGNSSHFVINGESGAITSNSNIDRETISVYEVLCRVVDAGTPVLSSEVNVTIHVNDLNDNDPLFSSTLYTGTVAENSAVGTTVLTMTVTDLDAGVNGDITLSVDTSSTAGANANAYLAINTAKGEISVKVALDREIHSSFVFEVIAVDGGTPPRTSSTSVSIHVGDINDNAPIFKPTFYNSEIAYTGECDNSITTVTATDADYGSNSQVDYYLIQSTYQYLFSIDSAGVFSLQETASVNSTYVIESGARDNSKPARPALTPATIRIDTFDPTGVIISFRLNISKADFQTKQSIFLKGIQTIVRAKYPNALVRLSCIEERSGTAFTPTARRRLLQSSPPVTIYVYTLGDERTESPDNINQTKIFLTSQESLIFFATDSNGSPSSAVTGAAWGYFGIESVKEYYRRKTPWEETVHGISIIVIIVIFIVLLIALIAFLLWWHCCRNRSVNSEEDPPTTDMHEDIEKNESLPHKDAKRPKTISPNYDVWMHRPFFCTMVDPDTGKVYEYNTGTKKRIVLRKPKKVLKKKRIKP